jgi:Domain of unknown function (DUF4388)/FHA domain
MSSGSGEYGDESGGGYADPGAPEENPYGAPVENPYGAPVENPYGAPVENPYGAPVENPYGAPTPPAQTAPLESPYGAPAQPVPPPPAQPSPVVPAEALQAAPAQPPQQQADERKLLLAALVVGNKEDRVAAAKRLGEIGDLKTFEFLCEMVKAKDFANREEDEVTEILNTLSELGGVRAVRTLEELSARGGVMSRRGTKRLSKAAHDRLVEVRAGKHQGKAVAQGGAAPARKNKSAGGTCPKCRFQNMPGASSCLQCGINLASGAPTRRAPRPTSIRKSERKAANAPTQAPVTNRVDKDATVRMKVDRDKLRAMGGLPLNTPAIPIEPAVSAEDAANAIAWLWCPGYPPVPVGTRPTTTIGRGRDADLRLNHESVSRIHVMVRVLGGEMTMEDRSTFGTYLNGERVMNTPIKPKDVLTVGPFDVYIESGRAHAEDDSHGTKPLRTFASSEAIGGRLERVSLAEVLQQIEFNEKTGTLRVFTDGGDDGTLVAYDGKPMFAEMGELRDSDAVIKMLNLARGNFSFVAKVEAGEMTMTGMSFTRLLMEASRLQDEGHS